MEFGCDLENMRESIVELKNKRKVKIYSLGNQQREEGIIFLHGFGMPPRFYSTFFTKLAEEVPLYAPEFVAINYSKENQPSSISDYGEMVYELIDKIPLDKICLVGHSLGGRIAFEIGKQLSNLEGRLSKIVAINPSLPVEYGVTKLLTRTLIEGTKQEYG
ncbi:MAG: alpha/beta hydrolase, partial [Nanoarchaeota archaeon]